MGKFNNTKFSQKEKLAYEKGYRIDKDGNVFSPKGNILKGYINNANYYTFSMRCKEKVFSIPFHRLQAYMKFGDKIYEDNICVRHLNNNSLDNNWDNLELGTMQDNNLDNPTEERTAKAYKASRFKIKYSDELVKQIREDYTNGLSYKDLMQKYNISSLGTISHIIKKRILDLDEYITQTKDRSSEKKYCLNCGKLLVRRKTFCSLECQSLYHKNNIPSLLDLTKLYIETNSLTQVAKYYNVTVFCIKSWLRVHGITYTDINDLKTQIENIIKKEN